MRIDHTTSPIPKGIMTTYLLQHQGESLPTWSNCLQCWGIRRANGTFQPLKETP